MFVLRFVVLLFLACYSFSMAGISSDGLNGFGKTVAFLSIIFVPALYMLPTYEAWLKRHHSLGALAILNIFLGWTVVGWVAALIWAFKRQSPTVSYTPYQPPAPVSTAQAVPRPSVKTCPYCAEEVMAAAIKCKHCGSDIAVTT